MRDTARRRDRHGRGLRGPIISPTLPGWRTRSELFDDLLLSEIAIYRSFFPDELKNYEYGVLDVPEQEFSTFDKEVPLARYLPLPAHSPHRGRIIFYRKPLVQAAKNSDDPQLFIHSVITEHVALLLGKLPEDIDFLR